MDDFDNSQFEHQSYNSSAINYQLSDNQHWTIDFSVNNLLEVANGQFIDYGTTTVVYPTNYERTFSGSVYYTF